MNAGVGFRSKYLNLVRICIYFILNNYFSLINASQSIANRIWSRTELFPIIIQDIQSYSDRSLSERNKIKHTFDIKTLCHVL